jgi:hypothetical protein
MENTTLRHCKKPKDTTAMLTAYLTVYDSLSLWYRSNRVSENPLKNGDCPVRQIVAHGFRGRVSQVRILPGPLLNSLEIRQTLQISSWGQNPTTASSTVTKGEK